MPKEGQLHLSKTFAISVSDYASQGNAILGIRDAGKTYTAMKAAEELLDNKVPIVVYDPIGVWKNLKIGTGKNKGYPVVVAGGPGSDIILTPANAVDIIRAAMKENVSLIMDFYSKELINKSNWIKIVQETVNVLMYENTEYGMRHIFLEEAAEFIPQRLQPQHNLVYSAIERLARMGRNARLGYTLINQRAEEVNKAILEISNFTLLHKQVGKNSLKSIQQWLELRQVNNAKDIIKSLPTLKQGECWAVGLTDQPQLIQISERKTFHPNPRKDVGSVVTAKVTDVSTFVQKMNAQLVAETDKKAPKKALAPLKTGTPADNSKADKYIDTIKQLRTAVKEHDQLMVAYKNLALSCATMIKNMQALCDDASKKISDKELAIAEINKKVKTIESSVPRSTGPNVGNYNGSLSSEAIIGKCAKEMIRFLAQYADRSFSKAQIAIATGYSSSSGGFNNSLSQLNTLSFIIRGEKIKVDQSQLTVIVEMIGPISHQEYNIETYKEKLGKCEREIYEVLLARPDTGYTKDQISQMTETPYSPTSGGFNNILSRLSTLELIERKGGLIMLNPELLELM